MPTAATRIWTDATPTDDEFVAAAAQRSALPDNPPDETDEPGVIETLADGQSGLTEISDALNDATGAILEVSALTGDATQRIKDSDIAGRGFAGRLLVTRQLGAELQEPLDAYETAVERFYESLYRAEAMIDFILTRLAEEPEEASVQGLEFVDSIEQLVAAGEYAEPSVVAYARSAGEWKKLSRDLREPATLIERTSHRMSEGIAKMSAWRPRLQAAREAIERARN